MKKTYWVSKYVLSKGIYTIQADRDPNNPDRIVFPTGGRWPASLIRPEWHETKEGAKLDARERLNKKLKQLENQKQKILKNLENY